MHIHVSKSEPVPFSATQLKKIFEEQDANGDGRLNKQELKKAFEKLGSRYPDWRVRRSLHHADANNDGYVSFEELDELVKYASNLGYCVN